MDSTLKSEMNEKYCMESRVAAIERVLEEREKILQITASALDKRLELLNELRSDVMTRSEFLRMHESLIFRIEKIEAMQSRFIGVSIALVAMAGAAGALVSHLIK